MTPSTSSRRAWPNSSADHPPESCLTAAQMPREASAPPSAVRRGRNRRFAGEGVGASQGEGAGASKGGAGAIGYSENMTDTAGLRLSRVLRDTESFLLPLTEVAHDVEITRIDFGFDMPQEDALDGGAAENSDHAPAASADPARRARAGAVVLITDAVHSRTGLEAILDEHAGAAALVLPPGAHAHLGDSETPGGQQGPVLLERSPHVILSAALVHLRQLKEWATSTLAWPDADELSALAAVIADLTGASITIEDPASRVLAHANLGDELDEIRRETILTGAIPAWRIAELEESGFLDTVRHSTDVVERRAAG